jgi:hypothetical protein
MNPAGIEIIQPRVAEAARLPWVSELMKINPERVVSFMAELQKRDTLSHPHLPLALMTIRRYKD